MKKMLPVFLVAMAVAWFALPLTAEAGCGTCGSGAAHKHAKVEKPACKTCVAGEECKVCPAKKTCPLGGKCAVKADCKKCAKAEDGKLCKKCAKACAAQKAKCATCAAGKECKKCPKK